VVLAVADLYIRPVYIISVKLLKVKTSGEYCKLSKRALRQIFGLKTIYVHAWFTETSFGKYLQS